MRLYRCEDLLCRRDVVGFEFLRKQATDLRLIDHHRVSACKAVGPWACFGEVRLDDLNIWMHLTEQAHIGLMLVDTDEFQVVPRLQARYEILPDKAGCPGNDDLSHRCSRNSSC